jgi:hypothetical protein
MASSDKRFGTLVKAFAWGEARLGRHQGALFAAVTSRRVRGSAGAWAVNISG